MAKPLVVLLHGLARSRVSMSRLGRRLQSHGFDTLSRSYPSRKHSIGDLAAQLTEWIIPYADGRPINAVTHSLGGVIARHLQDPRLKWGRIVMLAPPNRGSQLAAGLVGNPLYRWYYGPAGIELANGAQWPSPPAPFAVIAGTKSLAVSNVASWTIARQFGPTVPNDGTVAVEETKLDGMSAFAEVDATHTWIMNDKRVEQLVESYLRSGTFDGVLHGIG